MGILGSVENLSELLKVHAGALLRSSLEKVLMSDLYFLQEQCGLSVCQIVRLIKAAPRLISSKPQVVKMKAERTAELGIACSSNMFAETLIVVYHLNQHIIDARLNNLTSLGFSQQEVALLICRAPPLLGITDKLVARKMGFLMKEAGCDKLHLNRNPFLFNCSLENRLIPRNIVRKLLITKGLSVANQKFATLQENLLRI